MIYKYGYDDTGLERGRARLNHPNHTASFSGATDVIESDVEHEKTLALLGADKKTLLHVKEVKEGVRVVDDSKEAVRLKR